MLQKTWVNLFAVGAWDIYVEYCDSTVVAPVPDSNANFVLAENLDPAVGTVTVQDGVIVANFAAGLVGYQDYRPAIFVLPKGWAGVAASARTSVTVDYNQGDGVELPASPPNYYATECLAADLHDLGNNEFSFDDSSSNYVGPPTHWINPTELPNPIALGSGIGWMRTFDVTDAHPSYRITFELFTEPPPPVYNCDCDCGYETETLGSMVERVAIPMGYATQLDALQDGVKKQIVNELNMQQRRVVEDLIEIGNERFFSWLLRDGVTRYCTDENIETCRQKLLAARISEAYIVNRAGLIVTRLDRGIPFDYHSGGDLARSIPTRYELRSCIEVWPPPAGDDLMLVVRGQLAATPMVADTDVASCNADLVVMRAIAFLKSRKGHPDASDWMSQYRQSLGVMNADTFADQRFVPDDCEGRYERLTHVMEPRVYDETP